MSDIAGGLLQYVQAPPVKSGKGVADEAMLKACATLHGCLERCASQCNYTLGLDEDVPSKEWMQECIATTKRFSEIFFGHVENIVEELLRTKGATEAAKFFHPLENKMPTHLQQCQARVRQGELLEKADAGSLTSRDEDKAKHYQELTTSAKKLTTIWALNETLLQKFMPSATQLRMDFEKTTRAAITQAIEETKSERKRGTKILTKYRPCFVVCHFLQSEYK